MPSFVPRGLEPYQKRELLGKRVDELRAAIRSGAAAPKLVKAAERVRSATLAVVKTRQSILADYPASRTGPESLAQGEALARQLANLERESERWASLAVAEIIALYNAPDAEHIYGFQCQEGVEEAGRPREVSG
jgi:hypothetical protein